MILLVLLLVSFSTVLGAIYNEVKKKTINDLNARQFVHARQAAKGIQKQFEHFIELLKHLAAQKSIIQMDDQGREEMGDFWKNHTEEIKALTRTDALGRIVHTVPYQADDVGRDISFQDHMRIVMQTRQPVISEVFQAVQGYETVAVHVPVFKAERYDGTIACLLSFDRLAKEFLEDIRIGQSGYAWLISAKGIEIYCPVPGHVGKSVYETCKAFPDILAMAQRMLEGKEGVTTYYFDRIRDEKKETLLKHAVYLPVRIANTFWSIVVATPEDEVLAILAGFQKRLVLISMVLLLFSSIFVYYFLKVMTIVQEQKKREAVEDILRLNETRLAGLLELSRMAAGSEKELTDFALDKAIELTGSTIGYLAFTSADESMLRLHSYSNTAMKECTITNKPVKCPVGETGLWGEAVRQGRPVITNDYAAENPLKKGYPAGHVPIRRHMNIPLFDGGKIVLVAGVGNKEEPYGNADVEQLTLLMDGLWKILKAKRAEKALRESEARHRFLVQNSSDVILTIDARGIIRYISPSIERIAGYAPAELEGSNVFEKVHGDDLARFRERFEAFVRTEDAIVRAEYRYAHKNGSWLDFEADAINLLKDKDAGGILINLRDITQRKYAEAEKRKLQEQLLQSQRMESIGRLAGGVAHDFNNMLSIIIGKAELALMNLPPSDPLYKDMRDIEAVANRSADLTRQLLAFARKQTIAPRVLNLNDTIESMLKMLRRLIGEHIHLLWKPATDLWMVKMDPIQIDQILTNLIVNARDAIKATGKVVIETSNAEFDGEYCAVHSGYTPGEYVQLAVSDDGMGMDQEMLANIFEPFFTTKGLGKGTGLGLSTIYGIIRQNEGFINVYSEPGHGTTFRTYMPRYRLEGAAEPAVPAEAAVPAKLPTGTETVLLVEDEPEILDLAKLILERLGYTLLIAGTPAEALRLAKEYPGEIHLLVTDVVMPEMNGHDLAEKLLQYQPHLKCLFMSGYTADIIAHHGVLEIDVHFIQKPFSLKDFAVKLREVLGAG